MPPRFNCTPPEFFRYWESLTPSQRARVIVYPYRNWPKMDYTRGLSPEEIKTIAKGEQKGPLRNLGPLSEPFPFENWRQQVLHLWGSGDYHLKLNDSGVRGDKNLKPRPLCQTNTGDILDQNFPPVLDLGKLDLFADTNKSYIRDLQLKGVKIPGLTEDETQESNDDMANAALADTVKDLTGQVVKMATAAHAQTDAAANRPAPIDPHAQAQILANNTVAEASKEAIKIVTEAARRDAEANDPRAHLQDVLAVAREIAPKDNGSIALIVEQMRQDREAERERMRDERERNRLEREAERERAREQREAEREFHKQQMELIRQSNEAQIKALEARIAAAESKTNPAQAAAGDQLGALGKTLDFVLKLKNKINDEAAPADRPWWAELIEPLTGAVTSVSQTIQTVSHNNAVAQTGKGTPIAPVIETAHTEETTQEMTDTDRYRAFLKQIEQPMINALNNGVPGHVFAAEVATAYGMTTYDELHTLGESGIPQAISALNQSLWQKLIRIQGRFGDFLKEFLDRDEMLRAFEELQIARANAAAPPEPAPAPVNRPAPPRPKAQAPTGVPQAVVDARRTNQ